MLQNGLGVGVRSERVGLDLEAHWLPVDNLKLGERKVGTHYIRSSLPHCHVLENLCDNKSKYVCILFF